MKKKHLFLILISLLFIGGIYSCTNNNTEDKPTEITVATFSKALGNTPYYVAKHFNWFAEEPELKGIKFHYSEFNDRPTISAAFDKGQLQVLFSAEVPQYLCRAQGNDIRIIELSANAYQEVIVPKTSPITTVSDLKGRKIAVLAATSSHYALLKILEANNLKENDVSIIFMNPSEAETAFETGQIDAWAVWAPWAEKQEVKGTTKTVGGAEGTALINSTMAVPINLINNNKEVVAALVRVIERAKEWTATHPEEAQQIAATELGLDISVVKAAWLKFNWTAQLNQEIIDDIQSKADFLTATGQTRLDSPLDVTKDFIITSFVEDKSIKKEHEQAN